MTSSLEIVHLREDTIAANQVGNRTSIASEPGHGVLCAVSARQGGTASRHRGRLVPVHGVEYTNEKDVVLCEWGKEKRKRKEEKHGCIAEVVEMVVIATSSAKRVSARPQFSQVVEAVLHATYMSVPPKRVW